MFDATLENFESKCADFMMEAIFQSYPPPGAPGACTCVRRLLCSASRTLSACCAPDLVRFALAVRLTHSHNICMLFACCRCSRDELQVARLVIRSAILCDRGFRVLVDLLLLWPSFDFVFFVLVM